MCQEGPLLDVVQLLDLDLFPGLALGPDGEIVRASASAVRLLELPEGIERLEDAGWCAHPGHLRRVDEADPWRWPVRTSALGSVTLLAIDDTWLSRAMGSARIGAWEWRPGTGRLRWSESTFLLFGHRPGAFEPTFERYLEGVHPDDRERVAGAIGEALASPAASFGLVHRLASGGWVDCRGEVLRDGAGAAVVMSGTIQDVTARRDVEVRAHATEARLAAFVGNTPNVAVQGYDLDGRVVFWNPASETLFGWSESEAVGRRTDDLIQSPEEGVAFRATLAEVLRSGRATAPVEYEVRHRDGSTRWCLSTVIPLSGPGEAPLFACMDIDRTTSRRLEERVRQGERLEALGRLAGGIAHDFNNLLTTILGFSDLAVERGADPDLLGPVREAAARGGALTQQLLAFARRQVVQPRVVDLDALLESVEPLLTRVLAENVEVEVDRAGGLPSVRLDPGQFDQIVLNLAINASDAMPGGGRLRVATSVDGPWVVFAVTDTGPGMPPEVRDRVFEPFFTTKDGRGTGLGLATVHAIVTGASGHVQVDSAPGRGTTFTLRFPALSEPPEPRAATPRGVALAGRGTILLAEDDPEIRSLGETVLSHRGFRVLLAADGEEALALAEAHPEIDLLFSDIVMPRLGGTELARLLKARHPRLRVLLTSGYAEGLVGRTDALPDGAAFIPKPYTGTDLVARIVALLAEVGDGGAP